MDLKTEFSQDATGGDLSFDGASLETDGSLQTAILHSLFTDRRATTDDVKLFGVGDRRGWWGDLALPTEGDRYGSKLWLLRREKQTADVLARAEEYAREALAWLTDDGHAVALEVTAERVREGVLGLRVVIDLADGSTFTESYRLSLEGANGV